jgi:hypothetical protein
MEGVVLESVKIKLKVERKSKETLFRKGMTDKKRTKEKQCDSDSQYDGQYGGVWRLVQR